MPAINRYFSWIGKVLPWAGYGQQAVVGRYPEAFPSFDLFGTEALDRMESRQQIGSLGAASVQGPLVPAGKIWRVHFAALSSTQIAAAGFGWLTIQLTEPAPFVLKIQQEVTIQNLLSEVILRRPIWLPPRSQLGGTVSSAPGPAEQLILRWSQIEFDIGEYTV